MLGQSVNIEYINRLLNAIYGVGYYQVVFINGNNRDLRKQNISIIS